jgi:hypothetical protein
MARWLMATALLFALMMSSITGCSDSDSGQAPPVAPTEPQSLTATPASAEITAVWGAVTGATSYEVYFSSDDNSAAATLFAGDSNTADTTCIITGLTNGSTYYIWVKARNSAGVSGFSSPASATPAAVVTPPASPASLTITPGNNQLVVSWDAVTGASSYEVYYNAANNSATATLFTGDANDADATCTITGLSNGIPYYVWVKAHNSAGSSAFSTVASSTPVASTTAQYFAGSYSDGRHRPCVWYGTERMDLDPAAFLAHSAIAFSPVIEAGGTIYVAGTYTNDASVKVPCYWTRTAEGVCTRVDLAGDGVHSAYASGIAVSGGTVYTAGFYGNGYIDIPCYWTGSVRADLGIFPQWGGRATAITTSEGVVYVAGYHYAARPQGGYVQIPCYWTDGVRTELPGYDDQDATGAPGQDGLADQDAFAWSITVDAGTVYSAGYYDKSPRVLACYWVGASRIELTDGSYNAGATAVTVSGGTVYTGGWYMSTSTVPCYWAGTTRTDLAPYGSGNDGLVFAIAASEGMVYTGGYSRSSFWELPCYWAGITRTDLPRPGTYGSVVSGSWLYNSTW